jgi:hypothetical protein
MSEQTRRNIFENMPSLDDMAGKFSPKQSIADRPTPEKVAEVAEKLNFTSREATTPVTVSQATRARREPMYHRTGRTAQFTCKTSPEVIDEFYAFAARKGWKVGETFEQAFQALLEKEAGVNG